MWNGFTKLGVIKSINKYQSTARVIILEATGEHIFPLMVPEIKLNPMEGNFHYLNLNSYIS